MDVMEALQVLFDLLRSHLPEETATAALALTSAVVALVGVLRPIPAVEQHRRWVAPALSLVAAVYD